MDTQVNNHPAGSLWSRWDLHFHTPASYDYADKSVTTAKIVEELIAKHIRVIAVTDHHTMDVPMIKEMQRLGGDKLTVLPGIELRADQGGDPIHYICIFPENADLEHIWTTLQGQLGLTLAGIAAKGGDDRIYVPLEDGATLTRQLGGVVTIHAGAKSNSIENIKNKEEFQKRIKYDITKHFVDVMEIGQIKDIDVHKKIIFPVTKLKKPLIICSDNHDIKNYVVKCPLWLRANPTFRGLLMAIREPDARIFIGTNPHEHERLEQSPGKFLASVEFTRQPSAPDGENWFSGRIDFNPGLVAIVGNKGSGKSALADTLGLLGASKNSKHFSFLRPERFKHHSVGYAKHFQATLMFRSGETRDSLLSDTSRSDWPERLKYLPQEHVEKICSELANLDSHGFEQELKGVIFSHVPDSKRLGQLTLDDLVKFQTEEKQKRIDVLLGQLRSVSRARSQLEDQSSPGVKLTIESKLQQRRQEIENHLQAKPLPAEVLPDSSSNDPGLIERLNALQEAAKGYQLAIDGSQNLQKNAERRLAVANRLHESVKNFEKQFHSFSESITQDAKELDILTADLLSLTTNLELIKAVQTSATEEIKKAGENLNGNREGSSAALLATTKEQIESIQGQLDAPSRAYQASIAALAVWQTRQNELEGAADQPESLNGLTASLEAFNLAPALIAQERQKQRDLSLEILAEKHEQTKIYRNLYGAVQDFISSHELAKDRLHLEFRAELVNEGLGDRLLRMISQNRKGSFKGSEDGQAKIAQLCEAVNWEDSASVGTFLDTLDSALHEDQRENPPSPVPLTEQLVSSAKPEDVYDLCFGLDYLQPRYVLRWDGKDLSMLSPGERGTLLLVFYLLIDKSDTPLVIDQPEENLDNHTVAKVLVDCIREAKNRRQVFIVTHNPNLAVVCDADQVIHASIDKTDGNKVTYITGALENPIISRYVTDVLEGTRWAFDVRGAKYDVGGIKDV